MPGWVPWAVLILTTAWAAGADDTPRTIAGVGYLIAYAITQTGGYVP